VRTGVWLFPDAPATRLVDAIVAAEDAGLAEFWLGDEGPARDPLAVLAAAAVRTTSVRLGVGVTNPYLRHPAMTASALATIHELSGGRAVLGLGAGGQLALAPVGLSPTYPLRDCQRALAIIRGVLAGQTVEGYTAPAHAMHAPGLPVFVGARGERFNRWASAAADGAFVAGIAPSQAAQVVGWARSVRDVEIALYISAALDDEQLERARPRMIHAFSDAPPDLRRRAGLTDADVAAAADALDRGDPGPAAALLTDPVLDLVLARPDRVVATCVDLARELLPDAIGLTLLSGDPVEHVQHAAELLREVAVEAGTRT
jgi:5,10-methylenetetrahydromethanopterin reductase